jgi:hypothetical protein
MSLRHLILIAALASIAVPAAGQSLGLTVTQPSGAGSLFLQVTGAAPGAELFVLVSLFPAQPTGSGPIFGLGLAGSQGLIEQLLMPLPSPPFHVSANGSGSYTFAFVQPASSLQISVDVVAIEWHAVFGVLDYSPVVYAQLQF